MSPSSAYTVPLRKSTMRFFGLWSTLDKLTSAARSAFSSSAISCVSEKTLGSKRQTFVLLASAVISFVSFSFLIMPLFFSPAAPAPSYSHLFQFPPVQAVFWLIAQNWSPWDLPRVSFAPAPEFLPGHLLRIPLRTYLLKIF